MAVSAVFFYRLSGSADTVGILGQVLSAGTLMRILRASQVFGIIVVSLFIRYPKYPGPFEEAARWGRVY